MQNASYVVTAHLRGTVFLHRLEQEGRSKRQRKTDSINAQDVPVPLQFREAVKLYRRNLSRRSTRSPMRPRGPSQPKQ